SGREKPRQRPGVGAIGIRARGPRARLALAAWLLAALAASASPALGHVPRHFYGIVPGSALKGRDFELMRRANVGSVRFGIVWPEVQPIHRGPFYWSSTDRIVARAAKHNISLLPILIGTPRYESRGCPGCVDHIDIEGRGQRRDWVAFV